jgi:hypothetical protein
MGITQAAAATRSQDQHFAVLGYFSHYFAGFGIPGNGSDRHLQDHILPLGTGRVAGSAAFSRPGDHVLHILQVEQSPQLLISFQDDMATPTAIAPVRAPFGVLLVAV